MFETPLSQEGGHIQEIPKAQEKSSQELIAAVLSQRFILTQQLLEEGSNVNQWTYLHGMPIHIATRLENVGMVQLLLNYGADPFFEDVKGWTALDLSFINPSQKLTKIRDMFFKRVILFGKLYFKVNYTGVRFYKSFQGLLFYRQSYSDSHEHTPRLETTKQLTLWLFQGTKIINAVKYNHRIEQSIYKISLDIPSHRPYEAIVLNDSLVLIKDGLKPTTLPSGALIVILLSGRHKRPIHLAQEDLSKARSEYHEFEAQERTYAIKFKIDPDDVEFSREVAKQAMSAPSLVLIQRRHPSISSPFAGLIQGGIPNHQPQNSALRTGQQGNTYGADSLNTQQGDGINPTSTVSIQGAEGQSGLQQASSDIASQQYSGYSAQNQDVDGMKQHQALGLGRTSTNGPRITRTSQQQQHNSVDSDSSAQQLPDHPPDARSIQLTQEQKEAFKRHLTLDYNNIDYDKQQASYYNQRQGPVEASAPTLRQYEEPDMQVSTWQQNAQKTNNELIQRQELFHDRSVYGEKIRAPCTEDPMLRNTQNSEKQQNQEKVQIQGQQKFEKNSFVNDGYKTVKQQDYINEADNNSKADHNRCVICMEEEANYALVHGLIGHTCIGQNCKILVDKGQISVCPLCRKHIEGVIQIFG